MRLVIQRVKSASVTVNGDIISSIGHGIVVLAGVMVCDTKADVEWCGRKILQCKLWPAEDSNKPWRRSVKDMRLRDMSYGILLVSQFTLAQSFRPSKRSKPDFSRAMSVVAGSEAVFNDLRDFLSKNISDVKCGVFGAMMDVELINDGPVTIIYDSRYDMTSDDGECVNNADDN